MHKILFRLGLCPTLHWPTLPNPAATGNARSPTVDSRVTPPRYSLIHWLISASTSNEGWRTGKRRNYRHTRIIVIIIIITNENIKVMLSRKRCRGTLQDYKKGEISKCQSKLWTNRNVFSWCLNGTREETVRRDEVDCSMHAVQRRGKHDHLG